MKYLLDFTIAFILILFVPFNSSGQSDSINEEKIHFASSDSTVKLGGTVTTPNTQAVSSAAVILSVAGPTDRDGTVGPHHLFKSLAHSLAQEGIATIRFDDRGVGESGGNVLETTLKERAEDACQALDELKRHLENSSYKTGFIGMSEGGGIGIFAGSICGPVDFAVLLSTPVQKGVEVMKSQMNRMIKRAKLPEDRKNSVIDELNSFLQLAINPDTEEKKDQIRRLLSSPMGKMILPPYRFVPESTDGQVEFVLSPWYQSQLQYNIQQVVSETAYPILALYGELDMVIDPKANANLLEELNSNANVKMLKGLNHLMQEAETGLPSEYASLPGAISPAAISNIVNWLKHTENLKD